MSQVASWSLLDRRREYVAARAEQHAFAFRAERCVFDELGDVDSARPSRKSVVRNGDGHRRVLFALRIEYAKLAVELIDYVAFAIGAWPAHIPRLMRRRLRSPAARGIVRIKIEVPVAIRVEIDRVADPHRIAARPRVVADLFRVERLQIEYVKLIRLAAAIALLGPEVARLRRVDHSRAVGRKSSGPGFGHRQRSGRPAGYGNGVEPRDRESPRVALRFEHDRLSVIRPAVDLIVITPTRCKWALRGIKRELFRLAAARGYYVDLFVAVVLTSERDPLTVGRELAEHLHARMRCEARRGSTGHGSGPQIASVGEDNLVPVNIGKAQKPGLRQSRDWDKYHRYDCGIQNSFQHNNNVLL